MRTITVLTLTLVLALAGAACSNGQDGDDGDARADCVDLTDEGETFTVRMAGNEFLPSCFTASASQGIRVVNEDGGLHSFTIEATDVDVDIAGQETFEGDPVAGSVASGTYDLICKYHLPGMIGEVTVVE